MIDFILIEEDLFFISKYKVIIDKEMMNCDIEYNVFIYNKETWRINDSISNNFKIYVIDITEETKKIPSTIRDKDDWQSMIITVSESNKYKREIMDSRNLIVDYIEKFQNFEKRFLSAIQVGLKNYDKRPNTLKYSYKNVMYNIEYQKIIYIEKEQENKRCIIKTQDKDFYIQGCLKKLEEILDKRFIKCNRSYIINAEQVKSYDTKNNIITFKDGTKLCAVSRDKRKDIVNRLRGIDTK